MLFISAFFALGAAAVFGLNLHIQNKGLDDTDPLVGAFLSVATMTMLFWMAAPFIIDWSWWGSRAAAIFALAGLFFPAMGQRLQILSIGKVGPALTAALSAFTPAFAILLAVLFMGEAFGLQAMFGLTLMIGGLVLAALGGKAIRRGWPLWALSLPLGMAMIRGAAQPTTKFGLSEVHSPFFAALVMASVSTLVLGLLLVRSQGLRQLAGRRRGQSWFMLSGVINGAGILCLNTALGLGNVSVAGPLASTAPLFALLFGAFVFKREHLGPRHLLIALMVVAGAVLIVMR